MKLLAFDTSTHWLTVACTDGARWWEREEQAGQAHSQRLIPVVDHVLREAGLTLGELDAIAFGAGPGSFTGVRIACGVAQGLALGAGVRLVPVSTLEAVAQSAWETHGWARVLACLDARMREVYVAALRREGEGWIAEREPSVCRPDDVAAASGDWHGAGDGFATYPDLAARLGVGAVDASAIPRARAVAALALRRVAEGATVAASDALPFYVRHRVALTTAERDAGARL
ncbi:MAG: tRNA (adenosine(37)-N6)-threonylcarbamoyltransferase complex dimerization subunit type 1 TsaB [Burkholderiales bacterium]